MFMAVVVAWVAELLRAKFTGVWLDSHVDVLVYSKICQPGEALPTVITNVQRCVVLHVSPQRPVSS